MKSNTKIEKQLKRKTNSEIAETIIAAKKKKAWKMVAEILSGPRRKRMNMNLDEIEKEAKGAGEIVIPGKVLSQGEISKKKIIAIGFSEKAREKILKAKGETLTILEEIKKNPDAKGVRILTGK